MDALSDCWVQYKISLYQNKAEMLTSDALTKVELSKGIDTRINL